MELQQVVERYAEALAEVDRTSNIANVNRRTGETYRPGIKTMRESQVVQAVDTAWLLSHPGEFLPQSVRRLGVPYTGVPRAQCDHVFSTTPGSEPEWGVEVKHIAFVGNNGKNNDYGVGKVLSPYLKDRGLLHDALRLRDHGFTRRCAVLGYAFNYNTQTCQEALRRHPDAADVVHNIEQVLSDGALHVRTLVEFADAIMGLRGLLRGPRAQADFTAWRHPAGGHGTVWAWEVRRPQLEPDFDPRHPW